MPLYDYDCAACGHRVEVMHSVYADGPAVCPSCGSDRVRKAIVAPAIHFKGSGWAKKERRATQTPGNTAKGAGTTSGSDGASGGDSSGGDSSGGDSGGDGDSGGASTGDGEGPKKGGKPTTTPTTTPASAGAAAGSD